MAFPLQVDYALRDTKTDPASEPQVSSCDHAAGTQCNIVSCQKPAHASSSQRMQVTYMLSCRRMAQSLLMMTMEAMTTTMLVAMGPAAFLSGSR
jgi:hypothetical protein